MASILISFTPWPISSPLPLCGIIYVSAGFLPRHPPVSRPLCLSVRLCLCLFMGCEQGGLPLHRRLDFVKGFSGKHVADYMRASRPTYVVGEYWDALSYSWEGVPHPNQARLRVPLYTLDLVGCLTRHSACHLRHSDVTLPVWPVEVSCTEGSY